MSWQARILEYASATLGNEAAEAAGRSYLASNPEAQRGFDAALDKYAKEGLPPYRLHSVDELAALALP